MERVHDLYPHFQVIVMDKGELPVFPLHLCNGRLGAFEMVSHFPLGQATPLQHLDKFIVVNFSYSWRSP